MKTFEQAALANRKFPDKTGWQDRHNAVIQSPIFRKGFENALVLMLRGWYDYAQIHQERYESKIGNDGVLGPAWEQIGDALRTLLNGECGRLDCGTVDGFLLNTMRENGIDTNQK